VSSEARRAGWCFALQDGGDLRRIVTAGWPDMRRIRLGRHVRGVGCAHPRDFSERRYHQTRGGVVAAGRRTCRLCVLHRRESGPQRSAAACCRRRRGAEESGAGPGWWTVPALARRAGYRRSLVEPTMYCSPPAGSTNGGFRCDRREAPPQLRARSRRRVLVTRPLESGAGAAPGRWMSGFMACSGPPQ